VQQASQPVAVAAKYKLPRHLRPNSEQRRPAEIPPTDTLLLSHELAAYIGFGLWTLRRWRREGKGPPFIRVGPSKQIRYRFSDVQAWLTAQTIDPERYRPKLKRGNANSRWSFGR
jgi:predicted DNA-binding transcriptional regulator AlpA